MSPAFPNNGCNPNFINVDLTATHKFGKWEAGWVGFYSRSATTIGEGEAIMVSPKTGTVHKSHTKVSAAKHEAAMAKGARELKGAVIYRQGGKLYMMEEPNNETFRDVFDNF